MKYICVIFLISLVLFSASIAFAQDYILGEGDVLTITVYDNPDLKTTVRISGDGMITMPLIGQVAAANITVKQLAAKIEALLANGYIVNPQVNIFIKEFRSRKATILGEVNTPGLYELKGSTSLLELISKAGGLTNNAMHEAIIHRRIPGTQKEKTININLRQLLESGKNSLNIPIRDGDDIFIPRKKVFYVTGEVNKPNVYNYTKGLTVIQAITMAGGVTDIGAPSRIKIIRSQNGGHKLILKGVGMDQSIKPNDVIVVPQSYF